MAQRVKPPLVLMQTSHIRVLFSALAALLPLELPANIPGKAVDSDGQVLGSLIPAWETTWNSCLLDSACAALAVAASWRVNQWMEN